MAKPSSQGRSEANCRHQNLENQLVQAPHGTEEKIRDSDEVEVNVNLGLDTAGPWLGPESLVCAAGPVAVTGQS